MGALFALILILHVPQLYNSGGIFASNILLLGFIALKAAGVRRIKRWPLWVCVAPALVTVLDAWHTPDFKSVVFLANLIGLIYVFPNVSYTKAGLVRQLRVMVLISIAFLAAFVVMNAGSLGVLGNKDVYWYPLASPNMVGVLAVFVVVTSLENKFHWSFWGFGMFSLGFMPLILGVILALSVYAFWRLPRKLKVLVPVVSGLLLLTRFDSATLDDTGRIDSLSSFRYSIWNTSLEYVSEKPLVGFGIERWPPVLGEFISPHNVILHFLLSYGYVVGAWLVALTIYLAVVRQGEADETHAKTRAIVVVLIAYQLVYVGGIGHFSAFGNLTTLLFGLHLTRRRDAQRAPKRPLISRGQLN